MSVVTIGVDVGSYSAGNGTRIITLSDLGFVPTQEGLLFVVNITQNRLYYATAPELMKATISGSTIVIDTDPDFPLLETGDVLHIQMDNGAALPVSNSVLTSAVDGITTALKIVDYAHHEIHSGSSFHCYFNITTAATSGHRSAIYLKTPAAGGKLVHLIVEFSCTAAADLSVHEAPTVTANIGTHAVPLYNRYRDSIKASGVFDNATAPAVNKVTTLTEANINTGLTGAGTVIMKEPLNAGGGPKPAGGNSRGSQEIILKANTAYVFMITNTVATANVHHISLDFYEHTNAV